MQGNSLMPIINNGVILNQKVFSETDVYPVYMKSIRTEKYKFVEYHHYINNSYAYKMYNLVTDPREMFNLTDKEPGESKKFSVELKDYTLSCEKAKKSILGGESVNKTAVLTGKEKETLKSLGYLE